MAELSRRGLQVCGRLPDGPDRLRQEADLWLQLASAEAVVTGQTSAEVSAALQCDACRSGMWPSSGRCAPGGLRGRPVREGAVMADGLIELFTTR